MEENDVYATLIKVAGGLMVVVSIVLTVVGKLDWAKGFALGSVFSIVNFAFLKWGMLRRFGRSGRVVKCIR